MRFDLVTRAQKIVIVNLCTCLVLLGEFFDSNRWSRCKMDNQEKINRLIEIQEQKKSMVSILVKLTDIQSEHICEDDVEELEEVISQKQKYIEEISSIDDEFEMLYASIKNDFGVSSLEEVKEIPIQKLKQLKVVTGEIMSLLESMQQLDRSNAKKAKELRNNLAEEIGKINHAKKVNVAYTYGNSLSKSHYIDSKQ